MDESQSWSMPIVIFMAISAVVCAVAFFLTILLLADWIQDVEAEQTKTAEAGAEVTPADETTPTPPSDAQAPEDTPAPDVPEADPVPPTELPTFTPTATATPSPTFTPVPPTPVPEQVIFIKYTVVQGDSLYRIAQQQNSSIELMAQHGISSTDMHPGKVIDKLPIANPDYCPGNKAYVVRDHDVLHGIAATFKTTKEAIAELNNINVNDTISATQVICIPTG